MFLWKFFLPNWLFFVLGKDEPVAPTLHIKPKDPKTFVTPSPGAYNPVSGDGKFMCMFKFTNIVQYYLHYWKQKYFYTNIKKYQNLIDDSVYGIGDWPFN